MCNFCIGIFDKDKLVAVLARELDNEEHWEELSETEFRSSLLEGVTLEISEKFYIYTLKNCSDFGFAIINIKTNEVLTDIIKLSDALDTLKKFDNQGEIRLLTMTNDEVTMKVYDDTLMVKEFKLLSFNHKKNIIQFLL